MPTKQVSLIPDTFDLDESLSETLLTTAPIGFAVVDAQHRIRFANSEFVQRAKAIGTREVFGKHMREIFSAADWRKLRKRIDAALRGEVSKGIEIVGSNKKRNSTSHTVEASCYPLHSSSIKAVGIYLLDCSPYKTTEKLLIEQQQQMSNILDSTAEGIYGVDVHGRCTFINASALSIFGYTREECLGRNMHELLHYKHADGSVYRNSECVVTNALRDGKSVKLHEDVLWHKDGSAVAALCSFVPQLEKGKIKGGVVTIVDIRDRKRALEEVEVYRKRLELAQHAGQIGIFEWDMQTNALWWSSEEMLLMGVDPSTFSGTFADWERNVVPEDVKTIASKIEDAITQYRDYESEFRVIRPDGRMYWLKGKGQIYRDKEGKPLRMVGVNYDITQRKQLEQSLRFKSEASRVLGSSLDYQRTLDKVAQLAVEYVADWCSVDLLDEKGEVELLAVANKDSKKIAWAKQLRSANPVNLTEPSGLPKVLREGVVEYYPIITEEMVTAAAKSPEELAILQEIGFSSLIIAPLKVGNKTIGALTLASTESRRHYTDSDVSLAEQLAVRAALAIENARLYEQMHVERERINDIISNVPGVVWEARGYPDKPDQKITFVSNYVERMLGYTVDEWLSTPNFWTKVVHPDDLARAMRESADIFARGGSGISRFRWVAKSGKTYWVEAHSEVVLDSHKRPIGMRGVTMDISERVELEQRKDEFISMASHELKTPVTSIKVFTQLLESINENSNNKTQQYLVRMHAQIDRLTQLIADLLDVSKMNAGRLELRKEEFDMNTLVHETVENLQPLTKNHQIYITGKLTSHAYGDSDRIGQVLINLVSNAVKYSPHSDRVDILLRQKKDEIICHIKDYGIGIALEHLPKIFDRFYRVYEQQGKTFPGLGMGLYIVHEIVVRHGGRIWVESTPGEGSTFSFTLPLATE